MYETILFILAGFGVLFLLLIYAMLQALFGSNSADEQLPAEVYDLPKQRESKAPPLLLFLPLLLIIWLFQDTG